MSIAITINRRNGTDAGTKPQRYWDERARRFAACGGGLAAVCSYGMPPFYNWYIDLIQRRAIERWFNGPASGTVLEIGCGVGRWTRRLARRGHAVVGVDLSPVMVAEARRRAQADNEQGRCRFVVADGAELPLRTRFDRIVGVTVLQHMLDADRLGRCLAQLGRCLAADGTIVLLEAAPSQRSDRCNSGVFVARTEQDYLGAFARAGLRAVAIEAVDPAPFKIWFLPWFGRLPRPVAVVALFAITAVTLPIDLLMRHWGRQTSWHKVFVLAHAREAQ